MFNKIKEIKEVIINKFRKISENKSKTQKILTPEEREELESAGYALSRRFKYRKLMLSADPDRNKKEGREVHGWMKLIFGDRYDWLIDNDALDYAVHYALKYYNPEIFNVLKDYDFDNAIINILHLPEKVHYDIFPDFEFDKVIVLTQGEPFENAVHWIENHEWTDENGYNTTKTLAPCNFLNTGFTLWDLPVNVLKDTVGKDKLFFQALTTAKQITNITDQILKIHIYKKRQEEKTINEKVLEKNIEYEQLEERHQYLKDSIRAGDSRNPEEKLKDFAKKYDKEIRERFIDWKKIIIGISIGILIFTILFGITKYM